MSKNLKHIINYKIDKNIILNVDDNKKYELPDNFENIKDVWKLLDYENDYSLLSNKIESLKKQMHFEKSAIIVNIISIATLLATSTFFLVALILTILVLLLSIDLGHRFPELKDKKEDLKVLEDEIIQYNNLVFSKANKINDNLVYEEEKNIEATLKEEVSYEPIIKEEKTLVRTLKKR